MVKNPPAMWETWTRSLGWEDSLENGMATHSSILAWRIPWVEEPWWATVLGDSESNRTEQINNESGLGSAFTVLEEGEGRQAGTQELVQSSR